MNSLFYLAMLIGVGWLMIWVILPPEQRGKGWWPFDMRDGEAPTAEAEAATQQPRHGRSVAPARGSSQKPAITDAAQAATPEATTPKAHVSWRARRDRALSSRRGA